MRLRAWLHWARLCHPAGARAARAAALVAAAAARAAAAAPPTSAASTARKATPFGPCEPHGTPCVAEYECSVEHGLCMPTAAKREASMHHSVFRTAYEHALARAAPGKQHK